MKNKIDPLFENRLKEVSFFISAKSSEQRTIWQEYESLGLQEIPQGNWAVVGYINEDEKMPVCVQFNFAWLYGHLLCFYCDTSRFVDHELIEDFIKPYLQTYDNGRETKCDSTNFHICYQYASKYKPSEV